MTASASGRVRLCVRPCPPIRQAMVLDDPRGVKGNIRLFRPIHLHLLLDDPRGVKEKTVVSFSATKGVFVFWTARFFSHSLPHTSVNLLISFTFPLPSPHLLRISFTISFNLFAYLSDCYPCFEGDEEIFWENKHFRDQRAQRAHRPMGRMGRMGRHFFNTSRLHAHARRDFYFRCKIRVHVRARRNFRKIAAPSDPIRQVVRHHMSSLRMDCTDVHIAAWPVDLFELCAFPQLLASIS